MFSVTISKCCLGKGANTFLSADLRCRVMRRFSHVHTTNNVPPTHIVSRLLREQQQQQQQISSDFNASSSSWLTALGSAFNKKKKSAVDEKPWPLSVRIAGYVAVAIAVPMAGCTVVAEMKSLREWLEGERPHDPSDRRLGKQIVHFVRTYWTEHGLFDGETETSVEREKRTALGIAKSIDRDVTVQVYVMSQPITKIALKGDISVNLSSAAAAGLDADACSTFALEFPEEDDERTQEEEVSTTWADGNFQIEQRFSWQGRKINDETNTENSTSSSIVQHHAQAYGKKVRQITQTFSSWHFFERDAASESKSFLAKMSPENVRRSELEWHEAQLQMQLIDPFGTREIDEMQHELAQIKRELRKLNRWRWAKSILSRSSS